MAIGSSFKDTDLKSHGFFADWHVESRYNLCTPGREQSKAEIVLKFLDDPQAHYLICAHPTLIYFYDKLQDKKRLNKALIAVDEFHHVSADAENRLGSVIHSLIADTDAHIVAMTGSYFRGDRVPVLDPRDEALFDTVTYTYYEQLNGYTYLKSLGIDYAFYQGKWTDAVGEVLDTSKKTILHIPNVNSRESEKDKFNEVGAVFDVIGENLGPDPHTCIYTFKTKDGRLVKVADLVNPATQDITLNYLRGITEKDDIDIIIALGMAKEGFDWPWCEHALTVGYRNSLTEIVQIIGRATRDAEGKTHAQFTNLIAKPDALQEDVEGAVNSLLKAVTLSLLMEQVLAPNIHFRIRSPDQEEPDASPDGGITVTIDDTKVSLSPAARRILENDLMSIVEQLYNSDQEIKEAILNGHEGVNAFLLHDTLPMFLTEHYPEINFTEEELEVLSKALLLQLNYKINPDNPQPQTGETGNTDAPPSGTTPPADGGSGSSNPSGGADLPAPGGNGGKSGGGSAGGEIAIDNTAFLKVAGKFINLDDVDINLILKINPFRGAYDFISRSINAATLRAIQDKVVAKRAKVTELEACILWKHLNKFYKDYSRLPNPNSPDDYERRLAEVLAYLRTQKAKQAREERHDQTAAEA